MTVMERLIVPIEWKATADDSGTLDGYASTFGNVDLGQDMVVEGAFVKTIANIKKNGVPLLADHVASTASLLGTVVDGAEDRKGLRIKAQFSSAPSAQDVRIKAVEGHLGKLSIGYEATKFRYEERDGRTIRVLEEVKIWEVSVVVFPMNPEAVISRVKSLAGALDADARKALAADIIDLTEHGPLSAEEVDALTAHLYETNPDDRGEQAGDEPVEGTADEAAQEQAGDEPVGGASDEGAHWDHYASEALLAGRDPDAVADPADVAGLRTLLELNEAALGGIGSNDTETE